jgi:hypothetical protein
MALIAESLRKSRAIQGADQPAVKMTAAVLATLIVPGTRQA